MASALGLTIAGVGRSLLYGKAQVWVTNARSASKKAGGSSRNPKGRPKGKHRGILCRDGHYVTQGTIIARQLGLEYLPGLNVGIGRKNTLYAMHHGQVVMTTERMDPNFNHPIMRRYAGDMKDLDIPIYKTYFHVLTDPQETKFRLVDQI